MSWQIIPPDSYLSSDFSQEIIYEIMVTKEYEDTFWGKQVRCSRFRITKLSLSTILSVFFYQVDVLGVHAKQMEQCKHNECNKLAQKNGFTGLGNYLFTEGYACCLLQACRPCKRKCNV